MSIKQMQGLDELFDYKNQLMQDMMTNRKIVTLLTDDPEKIRHPESLIYEQVFPYEFIPNVIEHAKTFICCEVDIRDVYDKTFLHPVIYIWIFTHENMMRLPHGGVRIDAIASEIVKTVNGSRMYGLGELYLASVKGFSPINGYLGRTLMFNAKDFNLIHPTGQRIPVNRKRP